MKIQTANKAFTVLELLVVIATIVVIAAFVFPSHGKNRGRTHRITCINNLKQVGIGFQLYATDGAPYPEYRDTNEVWQYYQTVGREIGSPRVLLCPADTARTEKLEGRPEDFEDPATSNSFALPKFRNAALSFFYNPDAAEVRPESILAGDRNISTNLTMISGMLSVETNSPAQWTEEIHQSNGNVLLADGSAQQVTTAKLRQQLILGTNGTQRFLRP